MVEKVKVNREPKEIDKGENMSQLKNKLCDNK